MKYANIREEEIKNKVGQDFFADFDTSKILGNIDFCVTPKNKNHKQTQLFDETHLLWAEAKTGDYDTVAMFAQLILTIGKARTFDKTLPPAFLGAFDGKKIAFVPYNAVIDVFSLNDFNWNVTSSNSTTKEFALIRSRIEASLEKNNYVFDFLKDEKELQHFIKNNIAKATETGKILIDKNNFVPIYLRWVEQVKPHIDFNWDEGKKQNILDNSFYLADLFVDDKDTSKIDDDTPISENLFVVFRDGHYEIAKENLKSLFNATISFKDKKPYEQFWKKYKRPPLEEFHQYIIDRKDLLVPQDIRERKGAFFTPRIWVELSQKYIADVLGEDWQEEYYVWDCAAGTGNLLVGLTEKHRIFASTLDQSDVNAMHEMIAHNNLNLVKDHCFQFDFLNDEFLPISQGGKLPDELYKLITNEEKRTKLVLYINPPYAEVGSKGERVNKIGLSKSNVYEKYKGIIGKAGNELFCQFLIRIYNELNSCKIANFSKLKNLQSPNFNIFRNNFLAKLEKVFIVPADTFDNVKGSFPIGFFIWNTNFKEKFEKINADVFNIEGYLFDKVIYLGYKPISDWIFEKLDENNKIGHLSCRGGNDFQGQSSVNINSYLVTLKDRSNRRYRSTLNIDASNLIKTCVFFAVRHSIPATWLNDRDQFLFPNDGWKSDVEFQNDCLAFALFHGQNRISSNEGANHWIPFTEKEVNAKTLFASHFMTDFIQGKLKMEQEPQDLFSEIEVSSPLERVRERIFSEEATAVFNAGRSLWQYYHAQPNVNVNASLYDIREYFQGRNDKGKMNNKSEDETYMQRITKLRDTLKLLAKKIEPKVYEYGFLKA